MAASIFCRFPRFRLWLHNCYASQLPEEDHRTFTVYVRDRLPDDQDPQVVNEVFEASSDELAVRSHGLARPEWLKKEAKAIKVSLKPFPDKVS